MAQTPDDWAHELTRLISRLERRRRRALNETLGSTGLRGAMFSMLTTLDRFPGASQDFLAERLLTDKSAAARLARELTDKGLIRREIDGENRRQYRVYLTPEGQALVPRIRAFYGRWSAGVTAALTEEERRSAVALLRRMEKAAGEESGEEKSAPAEKTTATNSDLYLQKPGPEDEAAVKAMVAEWREAGGRLNPGLLRLCAEDYGGWLAMLADREAGGPGREVPQTLYLLKNGDGALLGAVALRWALNETNLVDGGHIAYGVRPAGRGKGWGTAALGLALQKAAEHGIEWPLVTCDKDNIPSRRVIEKCGGLLECEALDGDGALVCRYHIDNRPK